MPKKKRRSKNERLSSRKSTLNLQNFEGQNSIKKVDSTKDVEVGTIERDQRMIKAIEDITNKQEDQRIFRPSETQKTVVHNQKTPLRKITPNRLGTHGLFSMPMSDREFLKQ